MSKPESLPKPLPFISKRHLSLQKTCAHAANGLSRERRWVHFRQIPIERGGWNSGVEVYILWWSHDVVPRLAEGGRRGQRRGGAPWRHVAGGPTAPTHPSSPHHRCPWFVFTPWVRFIHRERLRHSHGERERERERERANTDAPATVINRGLYRWRCADGGWDLWFRWAHLLLLILDPSPSRTAPPPQRLQGFVLTVESFSCGRAP